MSNKPFNQLTEEQKAERLAQYEAERKERGTRQELGRLATKPTFKENNDGGLTAVFRFAINKVNEDTEFLTMTQYVAKDKVESEFHNFLKGLEKGQLVSVEWKPNTFTDKDGNQREYNNVWRLMDRSYADNKKSN